VPGGEACDRSVTHAYTSLQRAAATYLAPSLVDAVAPKSRPIRFAAMRRGSQAQSLAHSATLILLLWSA
jgi:hypothetical protein